MNHVQRLRPWRCRGFTLLEIMISLGLGLVLVAGALSVLQNSQGTYRVSQEAARLQENGRFVLETLRRDIRRTGFWGCAPEPTYRLTTAAYQSLTPDLDNVGGVNGAGTVSDELVLNGVRGLGSNLTAGMVNTLEEDMTVADAGDLNPGEPALIADCQDGDVVMVTSVGGAVSFDATALSKAYGTDARVYRVRTVTYEVNDQTLRRIVNDNVAEPLVSGVENMQILFGQDQDGDGAVDRFLPPEGAGLDPQRVLSIRVALLLASEVIPAEEYAGPDGAGDTSGYELLGVVVPVAAGDNNRRRLRQVFEANIFLRNG